LRRYITGLEMPLGPVVWVDGGGSGGSGGGGSGGSGSGGGGDGGSSGRTPSRAARDPERGFAGTGLHG